MIPGDEPVNAIVKPGLTYSDGSYEETTIKGSLTIRQQFAAMAMQGLLANSNVIDSKNEASLNWVSDGAVRFADALIEELNKTEK